MNNKKIGAKFEKEFCQILKNNGFYAHLNIGSSAGQPFDVQANKNNTCFQIDCKTSVTDVFNCDRIEPNQRLAFELLNKCGCYNNLIVVKFSDCIKFIPYNAIKNESSVHKKNMAEIELLMAGDIY